MSTNLPLAPNVYQDKLLRLSNSVFRFLRLAQQLTIDRTGLITLVTTALFIIFFALTSLLSTPGSDVEAAAIRTLHLH